MNAATGVVTVAKFEQGRFRTGARARLHRHRASERRHADEHRADLHDRGHRCPRSTPVDTDARQPVVEGAAVGTRSASPRRPPIERHGHDLSLTGDTSGGGFTINATTGVVTVADPTKIDFEPRGADTPKHHRQRRSDGTATTRRPSPSASPTRRRQPRSTATQRPIRSWKVPQPAPTSASPHRHRRQRPGRDLQPDRRHLRRRFHHQCHYRCRHRRRSDQDRLRVLAGPRLYHHRNGQRWHGQAFADLHHRRHRRGAVDTGRCRRVCQHGLGRCRSRLHGRHHRIRHRRQRPGRDLQPDR